LIRVGEAPFDPHIPNLPFIGAAQTRL